MTTPYTGLHFHIVLSTKGRAPLLAEELGRAMVREMGDAAPTLDGNLIAVGWIPDHMHLLVHLGPGTCLARFVEGIKAGSSLRANTQLTGDRVFEWQEGYVAFTVCAQDAGRVAKYILHQEETHKWLSLAEELLRLRRSDLRTVGARPGGW